VVDYTYVFSNNIRKFKFNNSSTLLLSLLLLAMDRLLHGSLVGVTGWVRSLALRPLITLVSTSPGAISVLMRLTSSLVAAMILAAASINNPDYIPLPWHTWLLTALIMLIHGVISSMPTKWIANFNSYGSTFNIVGLIVVIIMIPAGTNRELQGYPRFTPSSEVWGDIYNSTNFPAGIAILMSFVAVIWTMVKLPF